MSGLSAAATKKEPVKARKDSVLDRPGLDVSPPSARCRAYETRLHKCCLWNSETASCRPAR
jgi:hypothetical protein